VKTVTLTTKEFETIPGYSTKLSAGHWKGQIDSLLYDLPKNKARVKKKAWLTEEDNEMLLLELEVNVGNVQRSISFKLEPVMIIRESHAKGRNTNIIEEKASWKVFYELLEAKLTAARLGISEIHHEFMPYITKQLPNGQTGTLSDIMDIAFEADRLNEIGQLEDRRERVVVKSEVNYNMEEKKE
jgi:hypothetical protein